MKRTQIQRISQQIFKKHGFVAVPVRFGGGGSGASRILEEGRSHIHHDKEGHKFVALYGFDHGQEHHEAPIDTDPYAHHTGKSFFTKNRIIYGYEYKHMSSDDEHNNLDIGYMMGDDPLDTRTLVWRGALSYTVPFGFFFFLFLTMLPKENVDSPAQLLYHANTVADDIEEELTHIQKRNV